MPDYKAREQLLKQMWPLPKHSYYALRRISRGIIAKKILNAGKQYTAVCHLQLQLQAAQLLHPCLIDLSLDDYECYNENKDIFINSGFVIEEFGGNTISLKEVPYFLGKLDAKNFLLSIIDNLKNLGSGKTVEVKLNKIATMACKAAVKANDYLTQLEMEKLISDLRYIDNPFNCPHGRPIIIKFTEYELDKKFRRIV